MPSADRRESGAPLAPWPVVGLLVAIGLIGAVVAAMVTGAAAPVVISDPGPLVRWGLPVVSVVGQLSSALTLGLLVMAAFIVPETTRTNRRIEASRLAAIAAFVWAVATVLVAFLTFADLAGLPPSDPALLAQFGSYALTLDATRVLLIASSLAMVVAIGAALARERTLMCWLAAGTVVGIVVQALTSHSGGSAAHEDVVNSMGVHLLSMSVWVGGLAALAILRPTLGRDLGMSVRRYSVLALWAYVALAVSGAQQALLRVGSWSALTTGYGLVVLAKITILLVLGALGWQQRRHLADRLTRDPSDGGAFGRLALVEVGLMGLAAGLSAALARSAPPVPDSLPSPSVVLSLSGFPDPGPMSTIDWLTAWRINWLFLAVAVLAVALYVVGVIRLRRRGDSWPWWRTLCWFIGWAMWVYFTCGAGEIWGRLLFSVHMIMHMGIAMIMPLFLVPAAPITLALRALPARRDRTWGPREVLTRAVHSRALRVLANPVVAAALFFASLAAFYWTDLFTLALTTHTGHLLMMGHFVLTGYLFVWVLIGVDPGPPRWSPLMLLVILFVTISFHAFFGVALTDSQDLLAPEFFGRINLPWGPEPLADQHTAGMIAWGIGEAPTLALAIIVAAQWVRRDRTETVRKDRQADRDGDTELAAYNDYLASLRGGKGQ